MFIILSLGDHPHFLHGQEITELNLKPNHVVKQQTWMWKLALYICRQGTALKGLYSRESIFKEFVFRSLCVWETPCLDLGPMVRNLCSAREVESLSGSPSVQNIWEGPTAGQHISTEVGVCQVLSRNTLTSLCKAQSLYKSDYSCCFVYLFLERKQSWQYSGITPDESQEPIWCAEHQTRDSKCLSPGLSLQPPSCIFLQRSSHFQTPC